MGGPDEPRTTRHSDRGRHGRGPRRRHGGRRRPDAPAPEIPQSDTQGQPDPRQDPRSTGAVGQSSQTLSEKLDRTDGVIRPPTDIAPDMSVPAPTRTRGRRA